MTFAQVLNHIFEIVFWSLVVVLFVATIVGAICLVVGVNGRTPVTKEKAVARAEAILLSHLTEGQRQTYKIAQHFVVTAPSGNFYVLGKGVRPRRYDDKRHYLGSYCIISMDRIPEADRLLTIKMLIEADEGKFLSIGVWCN